MFCTNQEKNRFDQSKFGNNQARVEGFSCRKSLFLQKEALLAETASFSSCGISAEIDFFEEPSFGFRQNDKDSLSVDHYSLLYIWNKSGQRGDQKNFHLAEAFSLYDQLPLHLEMLNPLSTKRCYKNWTYASVTPHNFLQPASSIINYQVGNKLGRKSW